MSIQAGQDILASDFTTTSTGAGDAGKGIRLGSDGLIDSANLKFGGDGSDGALNITAGNTTTIDAAGASIVVKNYSSINIANTATLQLSNKAAGGTILILKCLGNCTIEGLTDLEGDGANAITEGFSILDETNDHSGNNGGGGNYASPPSGGVGGVILGSKDLYSTPDALRLYRKIINVACGSGGGNGGSGQLSGGGAGGAGGAGGGVLIIECAGALDFDAGGEVNINGSIGSNGANGQASNTAGGGGGGGGGNAGMALILYNTLTDNSGTINAKGGAGGDGGDDGNAGAGATDRGGGAGGGGGASYSAIGANGGAGSGGATNGANGSAGGVGNGAGGAGGGGKGDPAGRYGGTGGAQGTSDSNHYLITKNEWF